jgi:tetratricopeptide (TPR) repeat protein
MSPRHTHAVLLAAMLVVGVSPGRAQVREEDLSRLYGADYYTAPLDPRLKSWLALVEGAHANERVWNAFRNREYNAATEDCKYTLERFANHPRALALLGEIGKATGQLSLPLIHFEKALKLYPQYAFTHAQYGQFLVEIGAVSVGVAELREALRLDPKLVAARAWLRSADPEGSQAPANQDTASTRTGSSGN